MRPRPPSRPGPVRGVSIPHSALARKANSGRRGIIAVSSGVGRRARRRIAGGPNNSAPAGRKSPSRVPAVVHDPEATAGRNRHGRGRHKPLSPMERPSGRASYGAGSAGPASSAGARKPRSLSAVRFTAPASPSIVAENPTAPPGNSHYGMCGKRRCGNKDGHRLKNRTHRRTDPAYLLNHT